MYQNPLRPFAIVAAAICVAFACSPRVCHAEPLQKPGKVTRVTLYRGQAMVQREVTVDGPAGDVELIVTNLPEQVDPSSLFAEGAAKLDVRAVRFRERAVGQEPREEVRVIEEKIATVQQKILLNKKMTELTAKQAKYLDGLDAFAGPTAKDELRSGTLDAEALQKVTEFSFQQRKQILEQEVELALESTQLQETLTTHQRELANVTSGARKSVREAVVFLEKRAAEPQALRLNYLVRGCTWSPTYTMRALEGQEDAALEYNALIQQLSGESWDDVELTLSTASPALSSAGPGLAPFKVALLQPAQQTKGGSGLAQMPAQVDMQLQKIYSEQKKALEANRQMPTLRGNYLSAWDVNRNASQLQSLELVCDSRLFNEAHMAIGEGPTLSYTLEQPVSLAARADQQIVRITQTTMPTKFYHLATPVLSQYVYREAELSNTSQFDLLEGAVQVYLNNRFVGRTELPTVARGQTFVVGMGADPQLRVHRELADRTDDVQGGNRELGFVYKLRLENFKSKPTAVRLMDRLPVSNSNGQIRVTLKSGESKLSKDKIYQEIERPKGLLRWDVEVPASMGGDDAYLVEYHYSVEYDRQYSLAAAGQSAEREQQEFERLLRRRQLR